MPAEPNVLRRRGGGGHVANEIESDHAGIITPNDGQGQRCKAPLCCWLLLFSAFSFSVALVAIAISLRAPAPAVKASDIEAAGNHWVKLKDGRLLEYAKCGNLHGLPVYAASGYASTANLYTLPHFCEAAAKQGLYFLSISMPGFGLSDSMPLGHKRSLLDWPADVLAVLAKEGVKEFAVLGISTGCVHAAAVAHAVSDRITGVLLSVPTAPASVEKYHKGIAKETLVIKRLMGMPYIGDLLAKLMSLLSARSRMEVAPDIKKAMDKMASLGGKYVQILEGYATDNERATVHTYRGWADNVHTIMDDVPFSLQTLGEQLTSRGVKMGITTAADDTTNPPAMHRWFASQLTGSELLHFAEGWGHVHALDPDNFARMMKYLAGK